MSNHPMCRECVAQSVCSAKYGQPCCIEVHGKVMEYGKLVVNSEIKESVDSTQQLKAKIALILSYAQWLELTYGKDGAVKSIEVVKELRRRLSAIS